MWLWLATVLEPMERCALPGAATLSAVQELPIAILCSPQWGVAASAMVPGTSLSAEQLGALLRQLGVPSA